MFLKPRSVEEIIIDRLKDGPKKTVDLVVYMVNGRRATKQGVYKAIRKLEKDEIITVSKKEVSLSSIWLQKMSDFFSVAQYHYKEPLSASGFLSLSPGQNISFSFKNLTELDIFSAHVFFLLNQVADKDEPIFAFNYHQWFYYGRQENDDFLSYDIKKKEQPLLLLLGEKNELNSAVRKIYTQGSSQCHILDKKVFPDTYYVNIVGDFLVEIHLDEKTAGRLNDFFKKYKAFDILVQEELADIIKTKGTHRMVISKNGKKIETIKKVFKKYFVL
ncbi:MAG: hypothetical protein HGA67_02860 [Candidatus Yonathbacteria bacterium]|nr:hypothetical protein [Candidatus Yonathbacteria bacterium]